MLLASEPRFDFLFLVLALLNLIINLISSKMVFISCNITINLFN